MASEQSWPCLSLTFDGTLDEHAQVVLPHLNGAGLRATFFADPVDYLENPLAWHTAALTGHEIADGCLISAAQPDGRLGGWTREMIEDELESCVELWPGAKSFAYPIGIAGCEDDEGYDDLIDDRYDFVRGPQVGFNRPGPRPDMGWAAIPASGLTAAELEDYATTAATEGSWLVLAFGETNQEHLEFISWLAEWGRIPVRTFAEQAEGLEARATSSARLV